MTVIDPATETMPCPRCGKHHERGLYGPRPDLAKKPLGNLLKGKDGKPHPPGHKYHGVRSGTPYGPPDVTCACGAVLRHIVPIFKTTSTGWVWTIL